MKSNTNYYISNGTKHFLIQNFIKWEQQIIITNKEIIVAIITISRVYINASSERKFSTFVYADNTGSGITGIK